MIKQYDGTYMNGSVPEDVTSAYHSDLYTDKKVALSDCPAKQTVCGTKTVVINNKIAAPYEISTSALESATDSCHWLV